jgi:cellulose biosynthesis protein BcsQ/tetratricopeptide (TPR) repeat protein
VYIVTFYSFRGGVGRTTALVNVGLELVRRGRKVLLVDFDLESPDLTSFPSLRPTEPHAGMVDYVAAYREKGEPPDVTEYLYPVGADTERGRLWVMPAGQGGPAYWEALAGIDWERLYERQEGYLFFEDTRAQWEKLGPDYVLIDTHAGITPPLGISTRQLADAVVLLLNPHQGGRDGLDEVSRQIHEEAEQTGRKPIEQLFVATGVVEADEVMPRHYENDVNIFDFAATIPFSHRLLLGKGAVRDQAGSPRAQVARHATFIPKLPPKLPTVGKDQAGSSPAQGVGTPLPQAHPQSTRGFNPAVGQAQGLEKKEQEVLLVKDGGFVLGLGQAQRVGTLLARAYHRLTNALIKANFAQDQEGAQVLLCEIHARPGRASGVGSGIGMTFEQAADFEKLEQIIGSRSFADDADIQAQAACCLFVGGRYARALECLDQALELQPDSPALLWQRASYRSQVGMKRGAAEDLVHLLEVSTRPREPLSAEASLKTLQRSLGSKRQRFAPPEGFEEELAWPRAAVLPDYSDPLIHVSGVDSYVASALRKLRQLDPGEYEQVRKSPSITRLPVETRRRLLADQLPDWEDVDLHNLVRSHQWARLVELLRPRVAESELYTLEDAILLFLAWWGLGNEQELQGCGKKAIARFDQLAGRFPAPELDLPQVQIMALIRWKTGEGNYARHLLDFIDEFELPEGQQIFSYWHCTWVVWKRFKEDCSLIRQLFNGATISPPFLGKEPATR